MATLRSQNGPVSEDRIVDAEQKLGVQLPETYRSFMRATGGGYLSADRIVPGTEGSAILRGFWGIDDLVTMQHTGFNEVIPHDYVAVGTGAGGTVCVKVKGDDLGSVWWADYDEAEMIGAEEPTEEIMRRLADTFDDLLDQIDQWPS